MGSGFNGPIDLVANTGHSHKIARVVYDLLTHNVQFADIGAEAYEKSSVKERLPNCVKKQLNSVLCLLFLNWSLRYKYKQVPASASWSKIATFVALVQEWSPHAMARFDPIG